MRRFDAEYLRATREGMWESREALTDLDLASRQRVLDVGCGTGELTRVLREECPGEVVGLDADQALLSAVSPPVVRGDATRLPVADDAFDLVVCQALLVNLPEPIAAVREFTRASSDLVAVVEPDNGAVTVESTVEDEADLASEARAGYLDGVDTNASLGGSARDLFETTDLDVVSTTRYDHVRETAPPYSDDALEAARRKVTGEGLDADRDELLAGETSPEEYDDLRERWRAMGREVADQMSEDTYERTETVPFFVTVGRV